MGWYKAAVSAEQQVKLQEHFFELFTNADTPEDMAMFGVLQTEEPRDVFFHLPPGKISDVMVRHGVEACPRPEGELELMAGHNAAGDSYRRGEL